MLKATAKVSAVAFISNMRNNELISLHYLA